MSAPTEAEVRAIIASRSKDLDVGLDPHGVTEAMDIIDGLYEGGWIPDEKYDELDTVRDEEFRRAYDELRPHIEAAVTEALVRTVARWAADYPHLVRTQEAVPA